MSRRSERDWQRLRIENERLRAKAAEAEKAAKMAKTDDYRKRLWIEVCVAVNACINAREKACGPNWADFALERFDAKFGGKR